VPDESDRDGEERGGERPLRLGACDEVAPLRLAVALPKPTPVPLAPPFAAVADAPSAPGSPSRAARGFSAPEGARWTGELLRRAREDRGLSVAQLAERTKITRHHIEAAEADRYDRLPVPVYLRGILVAIAKELRLDGQKVARSYLDAMQEAKGAPGV
jgi:hypothetical protein